MPPSSLRSNAPALLLAVLAGACSPSPSADAAGPGFSAGAAARRSDDPRIAAARRAIDEGRGDLARRLVSQLGEGFGLEGLLLRARLEALVGADSDASRIIERARALDPSDGRVYATAAELHAGAGRLETADAEIQRGLAACGATPELERARGVYLICTPGGAEAGLKLLESARGKDPELPFLGRALGQAHLLVGKRSLGLGEVQRALRHAEQSLEFDPEDMDARRFLAEAAVVNGDFGRAVAVYEALVRDGEPIAAELALTCKNAAVAALLQSERARALDLFRRARAFGLTDEELGTGAHVLEAEADDRVERARVARAAQDLEGAEAHCRAALEYAPAHAAARAELASYAVQRGVEALGAERLEAAEGHLREAIEIDGQSLEAHHFLALALFRREDFAAAAAEWSWVLEVATREGIALPDPVHLSLMQAQVRANRLDAARTTLEGYLEREPEGEHAAETRRWLEALAGAPEEE